MSECCSSSSDLKCPQCSLSCKNIKMKTVFHQVKFPDILEIAVDRYYYCGDKACSVGYFSSEGKIITKNQLRAFSDSKTHKLCYCFDITIEQYVNSLQTGTANTLKNFVIQRTKSSDCACEIRNPSGQCCLINFKQLEKTFTRK